MSAVELQTIILRNRILAENMQISFFMQITLKFAKYCEWHIKCMQPFLPFFSLLIELVEVLEAAMNINEFLYFYFKIIILAFHILLQK